MHPLEQTYLDHDISLLKMIAATSGLELAAGNRREAALELAAAISQAEQLRIICAGLSTQALEALQALLSSDGRITVAAAARSFGKVRPLGPGARKRKRPANEPANALESLWYHGLIGRAFDNEITPQEYYYVPHELHALLPLSVHDQTAQPKMDTPSPPDNATLPTHHSLVDDACTTLAFVRCESVSVTADGTISAPTLERLQPHLRQPAALNMLLTLLQEMQLLSTPELQLESEKTRKFLARGRAEQLHTLAQTWRSSKLWTDVLNVPSLHFDHADSVQLEPVQARATILSHLNNLAAGNWYDIKAFISFVRMHDTDFQRPAGDYDSWYVRSESTGEYLHGFASWDHVDGAFIRYLVTGPLHWLGLADLSVAQDRFQLTQLFYSLTQDKTWRIPEKQRPLIIQTDGVIVAFAAGSRADRFLAARLGEWEPLRNPEVYIYRLSTKSLQRAIGAGISIEQILTFLRRASGDKLPQSLRQALRHWGQEGSAAHLTNMLVLRVASQSVLRCLQENAQTRRYLGETLGPCTVHVHNHHRKDLRDNMIRMGLLLQMDDDEYRR